VIAAAAHPAAYPLKRLSEVAEFLDEMRRDLAVSARRPGPYPYYGASGRQDAIDVYLFDEPLVLLAEDLSEFPTTGHALAQSIAGKTWVNKHIHVLRPRAQIIAEFLGRALEHFDVTAFVRGAKRARLTKARAAEIRVPLPPLAQQQKIVALLEHADRLRYKRRHARTQLDAFARMFFLERFGDPATNPRAWPLLAFGVLGENQDARRSPLGRAGENSNGPGAYPHFGAGGVIDRTNKAPFAGERLLIAEEGKNLVTRLSPVAQVAQGQFAVSRQAHVIAANGRADLHYLKYAIELTELRPYLSSLVRPKLKRAALERIVLPVPPLALQREFRALVERSEALKALQDRSCDRLDELYQSLRERALRGELFPTSR
jgi:type I restriction enzyme S subunit